MELPASADHQVVTAHLTSDASWLGRDAAEVKAKLVEVLINYRSSGLPANAPEKSPVFQAMCDHAALPMPQEGFKGTKKRLTDLQLEYLMDEMRGFPEIGEEVEDLQKKLDGICWVLPPHCQW